VNFNVALLQIRAAGSNQARNIEIGRWDSVIQGKGSLASKLPSVTALDPVNFTP